MSTYNVTGFTENGEWLDEIVEADSTKEAYQVMDLKLSVYGDQTCPATTVYLEEKTK